MSHSKLRILFYGTPDFAVAVLKKLHEHHANLIGVVTAPDKPAGRGYELKISEVKKYALEHHIPIYQPTNMKGEDFQNTLKILNPDLQIVVAFRMMPESVWNFPRLGTFNIHGSLLPQYRGAAPIHWAVINGETETGVTSFFLKQEIDTGDILFQAKTKISHTETTGDVYQRLMQLGSDLALKTLQKIEQNQLTGTPQKMSSNLKTAPKLTKENTKISWNSNSNTIYNLIRGLNPFPIAWTTLKTKEKSLQVKLFQSKVLNSPPKAKPGQLETDGKTYLHISTRDGLLNILELQVEGKKRLKIVDFLRGFVFSPEDLFL